MVLLPILCAFAYAPPPPLAESYLHSGEFARGETASLAALDASPANDEIRFGLGVIQFARAVENLGRALFEYGAKSENSATPFLRIPVPENKNPAAISYRALGRVLDGFVQDLGRAERTLAGITDDSVKLRLRLADVQFDFAGDAKTKTTLVQVLDKLNRGRLQLLKGNEEFRVHFDRGDAAWLRAYCHLLSAMAEAYRAVDEEPGFDRRVEGVFPKVEPPRPAARAWTDGLTVVDPPRLRRARLHLLAVCELNRETWKYLRAETDDDYEWLPNAKQKGVLGLPVDDRRIDAWLTVVAHLQELLDGKRLIGESLFKLVQVKIADGHGLNLKKLLDDPPTDLLSMNRLQKDGIDAKYLDPQAGRTQVDLAVLVNAVMMVTEGPYGVGYIVLFN